MKEPLEKDDIQGLVRRGYGHLRAARFLLCTVTHPAEARKYLRSRVDADLISRAIDKDRKGFAMQVAFSRAGLEALEVPEEVMLTFPREFRDGMDNRAGVLGDTAENAPERWDWGRRRDPACEPTPDNQPIHVFLLLYAARDVDADGNELDTDTELEQRVNEEKAAFKGGLEVAVEQKTSWLPDEKEHFGFRDGIAKAAAEGFDDKLDDPEKNHRFFRSGEFVLGYQNEYDHYTESPYVPDGDDARHLPQTRDGKARDLGKNGTYLVYRQLEQRVHAFWKYVFDASREPAPDRIEAAVKLASKMVGRWPGGAPLVKAAESEPGPSADNDFLFFDKDRDGVSCPVGSHIRRTNPRDHLPDNGPTVSAEMVRKHQLSRRGRAFGAPLVESMKPTDVLRREGDDGNPRGLHFICLVGHIHRQFEFMQNAWVKSPVFGALSAETDPIVGVRDTPPLERTDEFTCPADPVRRKYRGVPQFTRLMGGGYFFLPGIKALRYLTKP